MSKKLYITDRQLSVIKESINRELSDYEIKILYRVFNSKGPHYDWAKKIGINPNDSRKDSIFKILRDYHGGIETILDKIDDEIDGETTISEGDYIITFQPDEMYVDSDDEVTYHYFVNGDKTFFIHNGKKYPFNGDGIIKMEKEFGSEFVDDVIGHEIESIISNYLYDNYSLIYGIEFYATFSQLKYDTNPINEVQSPLREDKYSDELTKQETKYLNMIFSKKGADYKWAEALKIPDRKKYDVFRVMRKHNGGLNFVGDLIEKSELGNETQYVCGGYTLFFTVNSFDFANDEFIMLNISLNGEKSRVDLMVNNTNTYSLDDKGFDEMDEIEGDISWEVKYEIEDCVLDYFEKKYTKKYGVLFNVEIFFKQ